MTEAVPAGHVRDEFAVLGAAAGADHGDARAIGEMDPLACLVGSGHGRSSTTKDGRMSTTKRKKFYRMSTTSWETNGNNLTGENN